VTGVSTSQTPEVNTSQMEDVYRRRLSKTWRGRLWRLLQPPAPYLMNPHEPLDFPLGRWNLYIGGAGRAVGGYINLDLVVTAGVDVAADAELLPFRDGLFTHVECDAVLEHVRDPARVIAEIARVLEPGGYAHLVTPFCHPFHEYPKDYRRFTPDGLAALASSLEVVASGWRTGPTATLLLFFIEYVKLLLPWRWWRILAHGVLGWTLFPLRYLDALFWKSPQLSRIGNHCYVWVRKPLTSSSAVYS
jgi:SAM-dependent methyltransferase